MHKAAQCLVESYSISLALDFPVHYAISSISEGNYARLAGATQSSFAAQGNVYIIHV